MIFIETPIFTKLIKDVIPDDEYRKLQEILIIRPEAGNLIRGGGGLRKIRWRIHGRGKRGGIRIIYYWKVAADRIYMLVVYKKSDKENLTRSQLKTLRQLVEEWIE